MSKITKGCHYITEEMHVNQTPLEHIASQFVPLYKTVVLTLKRLFSKTVMLKAFFAIRTVFIN